jgi:CRISPR/Cas system-associated exonuclease Cas4 (RecB family)
MLPLQKDMPTQAKPTTDANNKPAILPALYKALFTEYQDTRTGIHVSDIVLCPRKRVFREIDPRPVTPLELNFFTSGKAIHAAIQSLAAHYPDRYALEYPINYNGIEAHIDIYDKIDNIPIEAKSMRKDSIDAAKPHQLKQLKAYMAITDAEKGLMLYQLLLHFKDRPFAEFVHTMTADERQKERDWLMLEYHYLKLALMQKKPALARHVMYDHDYNFQCRNCPYLNKCQDINIQAQK